MREDLISVIIPIYNTSIFLEKCLESVINQTYSNLEILLINDGSTDESPLIINKYASLDSRIKVFNINNSGVSAARNLGIKNANGIYITFVDSDDFVDVKFIEVLHNNVVNFNADISMCTVTRYENGEYNHLNIDEKVPNILSKEDFYKYITYNYYEGYLCNKMYKKELIINSGLFLDEKTYYYEDLIFNCLIGSYANKIYFDHNPYYYYNIHGNNAMSNKFNEKKLNLIDSRIKVTEILEQKNGESAIRSKYRFIFEGNVMYNQIKNSNYKDYKILVRKTTKKYFKEIIFKNSLSVKNKIQIIFILILPSIYYALSNRKNKVKK